MIEGLLGRKIGMVQIFDKEGHLRGATVIEAGPCLVTQIKTEERDGYSAVQLGFGTRNRSNKPMRGHLQRQGDLRHLREFGVDDSSQHKIGERIGAEIFQEGDIVDVTGTSKGRGFAGVVKRHGFHGGPKTHGQSDRHRAPGSIGSGNTPGRVFKGLRMAGHMGAEQVTVRGLEVIQTNPARGILIIAGGVPGARNGLLKIRYGHQTLEAARTRKPTAVEEEASVAGDEETPVAAEEQEGPEARAAEPTPEGAETAAPKESSAAEEEPEQAAASTEEAAPDRPEGSAEAEQKS